MSVGVLTGYHLGNIWHGLGGVGIGAPCAIFLHLISPREKNKIKENTMLQLYNGESTPWVPPRRGELLFLLKKSK